MKVIALLTLSFSNLFHKEFSSIQTYLTSVFYRMDSHLFIEVTFEIRLRILKVKSQLLLIIDYHIGFSRKLFFTEIIDIT